MTAPLRFRPAPLALATLVALTLLACTNNDADPPPSDAATTPPTPTATLTPTATRPPISTAPPAPGPWEVGEPISLTLEPYDAAVLTEVTPGTVPASRYDLDRAGGTFLWEPSTDRVVFIQGARSLYLAPRLLDERPLAIAHTDWDSTAPSSLVVRLDPFEVMSLSLSLGVVGDPNELRWESPTSVRVSTWGPQTYGGRMLPGGEYTLDLQTATLTLVSEQHRGTFPTRVVEETWPVGTSNAVSMVLQNGRRSLTRGTDGVAAEIAGHVERWALSPDGSKLLMVGRRLKLAVFDFSLDRIYWFASPSEYGSAIWSPDGQHIAATLVDPSALTYQTLVFDVERLDDVTTLDFSGSAADGLSSPPLEDYWVWLWRGLGELFVGSESTLSLLDVESGELTPLLTNHQPYDTFAWDPTTSTLVYSRVNGVPASILDLDEGSTWFDIPLLAASPYLGPFDMNWGAEGAWLALNTAGGRS